MKVRNIPPWSVNSFTPSWTVAHKKTAQLKVGLTTMIASESYPARLSSPPPRCPPSKILSTKLLPPFLQNGQQFVSTQEILARTLRWRVSPKHFASLEPTPPCTTKIMFGSLELFWLPQATHHQSRCFFLLLALSRAPPCHSRCSPHAGNSGNKSTRTTVLRLPA